MSKITWSAISRKPVNQKKQKVCQIHIFIHLSADFGLKIQNTQATEAISTFRYLENRHLTAQQTAQRWHTQKSKLG